MEAKQSLKQQCSTLWPPRSADARQGSPLERAETMNIPKTEDLFEQNLMTHSEVSLMEKDLSRVWLSKCCFAKAAIKRCSMGARFYGLSKNFQLDVSYKTQ